VSNLEITIDHVKAFLQLHLRPAVGREVRIARLIQLMKSEAATVNVTLVFPKGATQFMKNAGAELGFYCYPGRHYFQNTEPNV
jgi:hypothetical protein